MKKALLSMVAGAVLASNAFAGEIEIPTVKGEESYKLHGMQIPAVYLQPNKDFLISVNLKICLFVK